MNGKRKKHFAISLILHVYVSPLCSKSSARQQIVAFHWLKNSFRFYYRIYVIASLIVASIWQHLARDTDIASIDIDINIFVSVSVSGAVAACSHRIPHAARKQNEKCAEAQINRTTLHLTTNSLFRCITETVELLKTHAPYKRTAIYALKWYSSMCIAFPSRLIPCTEPCVVRDSFRIRFRH